MSSWSVILTVIVILLLPVFGIISVAEEFEALEYTPPILVDDTNATLSLDAGRHVVRDSHGIWYVIYIEDRPTGEVRLAISDDTIPTSFSTHVTLCSESGGVLGVIDGLYNTIDIDDEDVIHVVFCDGYNDDNIYYSRSDTSTGCDDPEDWTYADGETQGAENIVPLGDFDPVMALHDNGDISVAWVNHTAVLYIEWSESDQEWSDYETINIYPLDNIILGSVRPMLHVDEEGNVHGIWAEGIVADFDIIYRVKKYNSGTWTNARGDGPADILYGTPGGVGNYPSLIVGQDGVIWATYTVNLINVIYDTCIPGLGWTGPKTILPDMGSARFSSLGLGANGNIVLAYLVVDIEVSESTRIRYNIWDGISWSSAVTSDYEFDRTNCMSTERYGKWNTLGFVFMGSKNDNRCNYFDKVYLDGPLPPPIVIIESPDNNSTVSEEILINGTAYSDGGIIESVEISIDSGNWETAVGTESWEYEWNTTRVENSEHTIQVRAYDGDQYSEVEEIKLNVQNDDENQPPEVTITSQDNNNKVVGQITIEGESSDADGDETIETVEISIDEESWKEVTGTTSWSYDWDTTEVTNGDHTLRFRAYDGENYSDIVELTLNVQNENTIPEVTIDNPEDGTDVEGTTTITGFASDEDGDQTIETVELSIDGEGWEVATGTTSWSYDWDTTLVDDGTYSVEVRAFDGIDYSDVQEITLTVVNVQENIKPEVTILAPLQNSEVKDEVYCNGGATDEDGEIEKVEMSIDGGAWFQLQGKDVWAYSWDSISVENGIHTVSVRSHDGEDYSDEAIITFTVNNVKDSGGEDEWYDEPVNIGGLTAAIIVVVIVVALLFMRKRNEDNYGDWGDEEGGDDEYYDDSDEDW